MTLASFRKNNKPTEVSIVNVWPPTQERFSYMIWQLRLVTAGAVLASLVRSVATLDAVSSDDSSRSPAKTSFPLAKIRTAVPAVTLEV